MRWKRRICQRHRWSVCWMMNPLHNWDTSTCLKQRKYQKSLVWMERLRAWLDEFGWTLQHDSLWLICQISLAKYYGFKFPRSSIRTPYPIFAKKTSWNIGDISIPNSIQFSQSPWRSSQLSAIPPFSNIKQWRQAFLRRLCCVSNLLREVLESAEIQTMGLEMQRHSYLNGISYGFMGWYMDTTNCIYIYYRISVLWDMFWKAYVITVLENATN